MRECVYMSVCVCINVRGEEEQLVEVAVGHAVIFGVTHYYHDEKNLPSFAVATHPPPQKYTHTYTTCICTSAHIKTFPSLPHHTATSTAS